MNTRTCKFCGWVYPITQTGRKCKICGQPFETITCSVCGKVVPVESVETGRAICSRCRQDTKNVSRYVHLDKLEDMFQAWLKKVRMVPKDYPTLTEEQWLRACAYFDGCARCHSKVIDTRGFFISASLGGRYCDWNIIPLCERCATNWDLSKGIYQYAEVRDHNARGTEYRECLARITEYLGGRLDEAVRSDKDAD